ncbi:MAG: DNA starvation/stationary phase protection protein [Rhodobacteraceae bacterium GWE1_64_9]|nr:MAG: DNA starvation/stationary phase protection protein [Rhodobacteraceae bacterium GWE1_64_9]OHC47608.1 MAG: DNA starvation/stationary phase protection protein [Rhodobacteraceae bacterium GWF1_65_7]HBD90609.1 DNA starvation/stationary phase protection protein [Gemmobacter sp.]
MNKVLNTVPKADKVETGVSNVPNIADGLTQALADTYRLMFKTHAYHWNVEGPLFHSIHVLTEGQYNDLFKAADVVAERIRALGYLAPWQLADIIKGSVVEDASKLPSAQDMVADLAADHEAVAKRLRDVIEVAEKGNDPVTADLLTARCAFHEKSAWMLRATAK